MRNHGEVPGRNLKVVIYFCPLFFLVQSISRVVTSLSVDKSRSDPGFISTVQYFMKLVYINCSKVSMRSFPIYLLPVVHF